MMMALEGVTIILRYEHGAIGLTGYGWVVIALLVLVGGRS
jgi:hypothetical protein